MIFSLSHPQRLALAQMSLVVLKHIWNSLIQGAAVPFSLHRSCSKSAHQNIYWEGIDIFRGHNRKLKCGKMAVNSPFPGWEILCLGNTELHVGQILLGMDIHKERKERAR